jgi:hypothetical protein
MERRERTAPSRFGKGAPGEGEGFKEETRTLGRGNYPKIVSPCLLRHFPPDVL